MKVLHSGSLDVRSGGPALSTCLTLRGLRTAGIDAELLMAPLRPGGKLIADDITTHCTRHPIGQRFAYIPSMGSTLRALGSYDLYHVQGLWQYLGHAVAAYARKVGVPYVLTLRGMLYPQALAHSALIKRLSLCAYQRKDLQQAACIQATCAEERDFYRQLGLTNPVAVIPNPIDTSAADIPPTPCAHRAVGYLGRVHPRKRIERLIYAFDHLRQQTADCELVIIGAGDNAYEQFLRAEAARLKLDNVRFTGFLTGADKDAELRRLACLAVPSDFENFGNIVTEALVRGVPVIASTGTPWQELPQRHCGWWIDNDQASIDRTIAEALALGEDERLAMGRNGQQLMRDNYSVEVLGQKMAQLYRWLLGAGPRPEFVQGDLSPAKYNDITTDLMH